MARAPLKDCQKQWEVAIKHKDSVLLIFQIFENAFKILRTRKDRIRNLDLYQTKKYMGMINMEKSGSKSKGKGNKMMSYIQIKKIVKKGSMTTSRLYTSSQVHLKVGWLNSEKWAETSMIKISLPINILWRELMVISQAGNPSIGTKCQKILIISKYLRGKYSRRISCKDS